MIFSKRAILASFACGLMFASSLSQNAQASLNGQQIKVDAGWGNNKWPVRIYGYNQNGSPVTWSGSTNWWGAAETKNWWWVGDVTVTVGPKSRLTSFSNQTKNCSSSVPQKQVLNWVTVACKPSMKL